MLVVITTTNFEKRNLRSRVWPKIMFKWGFDLDLSIHTGPGTWFPEEQFFVVNLCRWDRGYSLKIHTALKYKSSSVQALAPISSDEKNLRLLAQRRTLCFPGQSVFINSVGVIIQHGSFVENQGNGYLLTFLPCGSSSKLQFPKWEFYCFTDSAGWRLSKDLYYQA